MFNIIIMFALVLALFFFSFVFGLVINPVEIWFLIVIRFVAQSCALLLFVVVVVVALADSSGHLIVPKSISFAYESAHPQDVAPSEHANVYNVASWVRRA